MVEFDIKVTFIMNDALRLDGLSANFGLFAPVLKKMKYLDDLFIIKGPQDVLDGPLPIHLLTDLPIDTVSTNDLKMEKGKIGEIVDTISRMKSLKNLDIKSSWITGYKLSPEELSLFKGFPIRDIDEDALDLKKENVEEFRQILLELKDVYCERLFEIMDQISESKQI